MDAVVRVARLAAEYRYAFHTDVVVDLIGYRRYGHSEIDDPTITQPIRYARIKDHAQLSKIYADRIGVDAAAQTQAIQVKLMKDQAAAAIETRGAELRRAALANRLAGERADVTLPVLTGAPNGADPGQSTSAIVKALG